MKKIFWIFLIILFGCSESKKKTSTETEFQEHYLRFLDGNITLPKVYEECSGKELAIAIGNNFESKEYKRYLIDKYQGMQEKSKYENTFFMDTTNPANYIHVRLGANIQLDKIIADRYLEIVKSTTEKDWLKSGINFEQLEHTYVKNDSFNYAKIKYRKETNGDTSYITNFMMTNNLKTFEFLSVNSKNKDIEAWVKRVKIK